MIKCQVKGLLFTTANTMVLVGLVFSKLLLLLIMNVIHGGGFSNVIVLTGVVINWGSLIN